MKMNKIQKSVELILLVAGLGAAVSAQSGAGKGRVKDVSLENDIRFGPVQEGGFGGQYTGPIFDGGDVFVDLDNEQRLVLSVEAWQIASDPRGVRPPGMELHRKVRLAGGTPGNAGAILLSPRMPEMRSTRLAADSAVIAGSFLGDGSFVVDLPEMEDEVFIQGVEFSYLGNAFSGIFGVTPEGQLMPLDPITWDAQSIFDEVRRATRSMGEGFVSLRFFGAARMDDLAGFVNATVEIGRKVVNGKKSYSLYLGPALAQRTNLVGLGEDRGMTFYARHTRELASAIEAVLMLDAFAGMTVDLDWARARLAALRSHPGRKPLLEEKSAGAGKFSGTIRDAGDVIVDLSEEEPIVSGWEVVSPLDKPRRAGDKQPFLTRKAHDHAGRYTGTIRDAGDVVVDLPEEMDVEADNLGQIFGDPQRAHDKKPLLDTKAGEGAGRYTGAIGDAGDVSAHLPIPCTCDEPVLLNVKAGGAGRYTGPVENAGDVVVNLPEEIEVEASSLGQIFGDPQRAHDKQPLLDTKAGEGAGRYDGPIGDAGDVVVNLPKKVEVEASSLGQIFGDPQRAHDKQPLLDTKAGEGASRYTGSIENAGSVTVDLPKKPKHKGGKKR